MTPAINLLKKSDVWFEVHQYVHDENMPSYGQEAADKLGLSVDVVFKTLVVQCDSGMLATAIIPVSKTLSLKRMAIAMSAKKVKMAQGSAVERSSGYVLGGVSPLAQKKSLITFIDTSASEMEIIFVSGGRRGLEVEMHTKDLLRLVNGKYSNLTN